MDLLTIFKCVLYELQPIRFSDAMKIWKFLLENMGGILKFAQESFPSTYHSIKEFATSITTKQYYILSIWALGWLLSSYVEFASLYFILSLFYLIFSNLGTRKAGELSAYSVFNKGFGRLLGTLTAEQFDNEIRHNKDGDFDDEGPDVDEGGEQMEVRDKRHLRKGKKGRRKYEDRLLRRQATGRGNDGFEGDEF